MTAPTREQSQNYERRTPQGFVMRTYRNMQSRIVGIQKKKAHLYQGLALLPRPVFYAWTLADDSDFWPLWTAWHESGRSRRLSPSIDRINPDAGYTLDNMRWITHSENSRQIRHATQYPTAQNGRNHNTKLTPEIVRHIRATYVPRVRSVIGRKPQEGTMAALARRYGVSPGVIGAIVARRSWKYLTQESA